MSCSPGTRSIFTRPSIDETRHRNRRLDHAGTAGYRGGGVLSVSELKWWHVLIGGALLVYAVFRVAVALLT